ncbi:MAG: hypothetical protein DHS20C01_16930 [marine bacterium B5-7]|nr:MAG: hypothetical protein DHS20C01_16930 [marine bacterium B5-7]
MQITFKLYASLGDYLPAGARENTVRIKVDSGISLNRLMDQYQVPREMAHLVLVNGIYQPPEDRDSALLNDGDAVAIWPPVAGG